MTSKTQINFWKFQRERQDSKYLKNENNLKMNQLTNEQVYEQLKSFNKYSSTIFSTGIDPVKDSSEEPDIFQYKNTPIEECVKEPDNWQFGEVKPSDDSSIVNNFVKEINNNNYYVKASVLDNKFLVKTQDTFPFSQDGVYYDIEDNVIYVSSISGQNGIVEIYSLNNSTINECISVFKNKWNK